MTLPYVHPADPTAVDSPLAISLDEPDALDPLLAGPNGARLARTFRAGHEVTPTMILTTEAIASLPNEGPDAEGVLFSMASEGESPTIQALREIWNIIGRGGVMPVKLLPGAGSLSDRLTSYETWPRFVGGAIDQSANHPDQAQLAQYRPKHHSEIAVDPNPDHPGMLDISLTRQTAIGRITIDSSGERHTSSTVTQWTHRTWLQRLSDRRRARDFHATMTSIFELFAEPIRVHALAEPAGLVSITGIEAR